MGTDFQHVLQHFGIKDVATSIHNPQANAICEHLHYSVGNALRVFLSQGIPFNVMNIAELVDSALIATAQHASRASLYRTLGMTPGGLSSTEVPSGEHEKNKCGRKRRRLATQLQGARSHHVQPSEFLDPICHRLEVYAPKRFSILIRCWVLNILVGWCTNPDCITIKVEEKSMIINVFIPIV
jgi:hypothetical protein